MFFDKKKFSKNLSIISILFFLMCSMFTSDLLANMTESSQQELIDKNNIPFSTNAKQAIVMDYDTEAILFDKNAFSRMTPSSMTKMLMIYASFSYLKDKNIPDDSLAKISKSAWKMSGSKMFLEVGKEAAVGDLIRGIIIQSGNDACIVLADKLFGSSELCVQYMNELAQKIGMKNSNFVNIHGWPDNGHYSCAYDMAILSKALIKTFPERYKVFSEKEFTYSNIHQYNRNSLLWDDIGVDGLKTGSTEAGGYGVAISAIRDGRRIIVVVNGCKTSSERSQEAKKLLEFGYNQFSNYSLSKNNGESEPVQISMGKKKIIKSCIEGGVSSVTIPANLIKALKVKLTSFNAEAPIKKGQKVGLLTLSFDGKSQEVFNFNLLANEDVERLNILEIAFEKIRSFFQGLKF